MRIIILIALGIIKALFRKKDFYVFFLLLIALMIFLLVQDFSGIQDVSRYLKDVGFWALWIFTAIISVTFSAKLVPQEIQSGTVLPLLAKPVSRRQFVFAQWAGSILAVGCAFTAFFFVWYCVVILRGGDISFVHGMQSYMLGICFVMVLCAVSILFSLVISYSAAVTLSLILYFFTMWFHPSLYGFVVQSRGITAVLGNSLFYLLPHYEFYDMHVRVVHQWPPLPFPVFGGIVLYTLLYCALVLLASDKLFAGKFL